MPVSDGHITAPVGLATVAQTLGEARLDTDTLCRSDKTNPYSLIRPLFRKTSSPGTNPAWFAGTSETNDNSYRLTCVPTAHQSRLFPTTSGGTEASINLADKTAAEYPCKNDFNFTYPIYIKYAMCKWGFVVPYVTEEAAIFALRDLVWERFYPADDAAREGWSELQQFDGYLHNAAPVNPLKDVMLQYGNKIRATPQTSVGNYTDAQVLGSTGKAHPGGVVSIPAVIGVGGQYGMTIFYRQSGSTKYTRIRSVLSGKITASGSGLTVLNQMMIEDYPRASGEWILIPWVAQGGTVSVNSAGVLSANGAKIFGFRFSKLFQGYEYANITAKVIVFGGFLSSQTIAEITPDTSLTATSGKGWKLTVLIRNPYTQYPLTAADFFFEYEYWKSSNPNGNPETRRLGVLSGLYDHPSGTTINQSLGTATTPVSFSMGQATTGTNPSVTLNNAQFQLGICTVTIKFMLPDEAYLSKAPVLTKFAFTSVDNNNEIKPIKIAQQLGRQLIPLT